MDASSCWSCLHARQRPQHRPALPPQFSLDIRQSTLYRSIRTMARSYRTRLYIRDRSLFRSVVHYTRPANAWQDESQSVIRLRNSSSPYHPHRPTFNLRRQLLPAHGRTDRIELSRDTSIPVHADHSRSRHHHCNSPMPATFHGGNSNQFRRGDRKPHRLLRRPHERFAKQKRKRTAQQEQRAHQPQFVERQSRGNV
jgi:hypothetical protein